MTDLVRIECTHGPEPRLCAVTVSGAVVWVPWCRDSKGVPRAHYGPASRYAVGRLTGSRSTAVAGVSPGMLDDRAPVSRPIAHAAAKD